MASTTRAAAGCGVLALPFLTVALLFGSGAEDAQATTTCSLSTSAGPGGASGVSTSVSLDSDQVANARTVIAAAKGLGLQQAAGVIGEMTALQESSLKILANPTVPASMGYPHQGVGTNADSLDLFQQRPSQGWGTVAQLMDPGYASTKFFQTLQSVAGWESMPPWQAAQAVQRSADGTLYAKWGSEAQALVAALWDGTSGTLTCTDAGTSLPAADSHAAAVALAYAEAQIGKPYQWGGTGPSGYDCSGLTYMAYRAAGIHLPRTSEYQWGVGLSVPADQLQPGDLLFFNPGEQIAGLPGHVGMYVGNGLMVDAPHTGAFVRMEPIGHFGSYLGARRVVVDTSK